ncbi:MAG TPA: hypothetical protein VFR15_11885 [Chloroflexia bacterium]|nr:hypothetical protein [Chloroflexia bacterium]
MGNSDNKPAGAGADRPTGGARAYRTPSRPEDDAPKERERGMSSVAMRARKARREPERESKRGRRAEKKPAADEKRDEGEQTIRKGIYLSALIWVEGDWPAARDFATPAKAAARDALEAAFEGEHDGLTLRLKNLEVRTDVEEADGEAGAEGEQKEEEKFEF